MGKELKKEKNKRLWLVVLLLFIAVAATAGIYVSNLEKNTPVENENVIPLTPESAEDTEAEAEDENKESVVEADNNTDSESEQEKTSEKKPVQKNNKTYHTVVKTEKRQIGTKDAKMETEDGAQTWSSDTTIDIFDQYYRGMAGDVTVANDGSDSANLIAPGTESSYTFWVKNTGAVGVSYEVSFEELSTPGYDIPLEVRVKYGEQYILGNATVWEPVERLNTVLHEGRLHVKNYARYTLEWRWPFEGDDVNDTYLGDTAVQKKLQQQILIHTYGEGYDRPIYDYVNIMGIQTGDAANVMLWIGIAGAAVVLWLICFMKRKKSEKSEAE